MKTNKNQKNQKAAALKYNTGYEAPVVTAAGAGFIAEKIIEKASENNVPIVENKELAELLTKTEIGDSIPAELYDAVARILAYVLDIDNSL
ncbi:flagellar biosynthesis protein [Hathewaya proteolytica DSM 3090]|uniref:Flagellar biosynthesis protein n=1 Tax=Hathewaya proteolytica DSM 3090 TaxID=1121331 RepID=A0A1M6N8W0_9CLOT|nr:EscU/YscU/HrcU family type III secretion system export apparatus switch protein [Hathewaya proteolytica]SHJ92139.1 flagellar biosynthesis protein [Hathewaya proteolytica DSM 3090]